MKKKTSGKKTSSIKKEPIQEIKAPVEKPKMLFEGRVVGKVVNPPKPLSGGGTAIDVGVWRDPHRPSDARVTFIQALVDEATIKPIPDLVKGDSVSVMGSIYEATWISKKDKTLNKRHFIKASSITKLDLTFD
jgi:hypothetical protein